MNILADMTVSQLLIAWALIGLCVLMVFVILLQRGRGGGLAGAFGGGGGSTSAFGAKTGDVLTWITVGLAAFFVLLSVIGNFSFDRSKEARERMLEERRAAAFPTIPAAPPSNGAVPPVVPDSGPATPPGAVDQQPAPPTTDEAPPSGSETDKATGDRPDPGSDAPGAPDDPNDDQ